MPDITFSLLLQMLINGISTGLLYVLIALGLTIVFGIMGIINFAHGEFYMLGAYIMFYSLTLFNINFFPALILVMVIVAPVGILVERIFYRPLRDNPMSVLIVAIGLSLFFVSAGYLGFGIQDNAFPSPFKGILRIGGAVISKERLMTLAVCAILVAGLYFFVHMTKMGRAMRAVEQDPDAASSVGVSIDRTYAICMAVGAALAGAAGALIGMLTVISPSMGGVALFKAFMIIVIGGLGSVVGAIFGGIILGLVESFATTLIAPEIASMIAFGLIILLLILKPEGLFGRA
jgi:branched-chain amino acid transport system permease protein